MTNRTADGESTLKYQLLDDGTFVIEDYNKAKPFASFFPGIAGLKGIPLWAFYCNRGQGIASFGVKNKNYALMEFFPANNSYAFTPSLGFRTFVKIEKHGKTVFYEPFRNTVVDSSIRQRMLIRPYEVLFEETNPVLGLKTTVRYFTLPQEPIAALVRIVSFENIGAGEAALEVIDGLPKILPYFMGEYAVKNMSYTSMAWATVTNFDRTGVPFYKLKVEINDRPEVTPLTAGNFYFGLSGAGNALAKTAVIIDPAVAFGEDESFTSPQAFIKSAGAFAVPKKQSGNNKYPSALSYSRFPLPAGRSHTVYSMAGHIESEEKLNRFVKQASSVKYFEHKVQENRTIIENITDAVATVSANKSFDLYCRQTYLDNLLRGGMPILLPAGEKEKVFYVYSRKHGDLERDYNSFQTSPTYYSQGNGSFRDMNQNKRSDIFFNPKIGDFNVLSFYNLMQLDGYNPLVIKGTLFSFNARTTAGMKLLKKLGAGKNLSVLQEFFEKPFEPGSLLLFLDQRGIKLSVPSEEFLSSVLAVAATMHEAEHGEGFWTDHWTYNIDLLESYLCVYPEKEREILLEKKEFTFYDNAYVVLPRSEKQVNADGNIRQFGAVNIDTAKAKLLRGRAEHIHVVRDHRGAGAIYRTTLLGKMLCLAVNKIATLDPDGIGIEMEADKPGWYDALNGLPGIFGSSVPETFELKRMLLFLRDRLTALAVSPEYRIKLPEELARFYTGMDRLLRQEGLTPFAFWDRATALKEAYRRETLLGVSGKEKDLSWREVSMFIDKALRKIDAGLEKALDPATKLYYTYFSYEAAACKKLNRINHKGWPCVQVTKFRRRPLPLFLEAEVHYLKTETERSAMLAHLRSLRNSPLYDKKLGMYKVNASLAKESHDLGRCTVFSPGWLENESVWLHMEYKYLLELLKAGLYRQFYEDFKKAGVCFMDPAIYGRSILENSSFIASSAFPDAGIWGRGYVARLSGSTAEFLQMWLLMTVGPRPFRMNGHSELFLEFSPAIPGEFFDGNNEFNFTFLGKIPVKYRNPSRHDTFAPDAKIHRIDIRWKDGKTETVYGAAVAGRSAERVRGLEAAAITVYY
jgi:hypothetical protein